jgi:hypothetical protein
MNLPSQNSREWILPRILRRSSSVKGLGSRSKASVMVVGHL